MYLLKGFSIFIEIPYMKSLALTLILAMPAIAPAQGVFSNQTSATLQKVICDYPNHFKNIQGDLVSSEAQSADYNSKVSIPGALSAVVTRYSSSDAKSVYSWKCVIKESEDFESISSLYHQLYNQLKNSIIKIEGQKPFILNGSYEAPTEEKKFTTSDFYLLPATGDMKKLKVELTLEFYVTEWKMAIQVYDQGEEDAFVKE